MNQKILSIICILYILFVYGCAKQEIPKEPTITIEAEANAVLTKEQAECNKLGENIISKCMSQDTLKQCFELKQQWDVRRCGQ